MSYQFHWDALMQECEALYSTYPVDVSNLYDILDELDAQNPRADSFTRKGYIYQVAAEHCRVHLFPSCPFYAEIVTGRERNSVTSGFPPIPGIASWLMKTDPDFEKEFERWSTPYRETGIFSGVMFTDTAHHFADCETILRLGYSGVRQKALAHKPETAREKAFLNSIVTACDSACQIGENFSKKAAELLSSTQSPQHRENLERIRDTAYRIPREPATTFYEALCAIWFVREICNALEGIGFAVIGHLDRLLAPYYEQDIEQGRLTREEAKNLLACFLALTDARWDLTDIPGGTNAAVIIGGCDGNGNVLFNEVTKLIIEVFQEYPLANPKLQARLSDKHPGEYTEMLGKLAGKGSNVLSVFNDSVIIEAHVAKGKRREDCNLYLAGGCQEIVIHREVNCRAHVYVNLPQLLLIQLAPEKWEFIKTDGIYLTPVFSAADFDAFYDRALFNFTVILQGMTCGFNRFEGRWRDYNPCPMFSSTMEDCIENALDISEGGARYNSSSYGMAGFGTLVDSLFAIKRMVYDEKRLSLAEYARILDRNFEGEEVFRQELLNKLPKYGQDFPEIRDFAARVLRDVAGCLRAFANGRNGYYEPSLFSFYSYSWLKEYTGATPDGRLAGAGLSRGINPSESTAGIDAATLVHVQQSMDYTQYPGGAVLYMDLPITKAHLDNAIYRDVILYFLKNRGCMMDFNVVNREQLLEAQQDPQNHKNIIVRVCGYSAPFYSLSREMQDEVISRIQR